MRRSLMPDSCCHSGIVGRIFLSECEKDKRRKCHVVVSVTSFMFPAPLHHHHHQELLHLPWHPQFSTRLGTIWLGHLLFYSRSREDQTSSLWLSLEGCIRATLGEGRVLWALQLKQT